MIEFGRTLREAREAKGYTIAQIAEITHMLHAIVQGLENEDFSRIAAPIYGRGFVKLYCEAVGLQPKPMVDEFMEIYNGNRDLGIKERPVREPAAPVQAEPEKPIPARPVVDPQPAVVTAAEPPPISQDLFAPQPPQVEPVAPSPAPAPARSSVPHDREPTPAAEPPLDLFAPQPSPAPSAPPAAPAATEPTTERTPPRLSRYATPIPESDLDDGPSFRLPRLPRIPACAWRIAVLLIVAALLLWGLLVGVRALYRATSGKESSQSETAAETPTPARATPSMPAPTTPSATKPAAPRTPQDIPPLYFD